jgi:2-succinyl-5-enolpyruvyl-6-hydroxy-3-cyclohexene-1-carboxylate synthase
MADHLSNISVLVRSLYENGVRYAVISPGSRSTPVTLAFAIHKGFRKHIVIDERSAGFIALGIGKETGVPAVLVCTSGTAAANYLPAVAEAKHSGVPMIIISADRPPHLRGIGSSQTIDQFKLYGDQAVFFHEIGELRNEIEDLKRLELLGRQSVHDSVFYGGAVHLNAAFRKPLEPTESELIEQEKITAKLTAKASKPVPRSGITWKPDQDLEELLNSSVRPVIVAGPMNPHHCLKELLFRLSDKKKIPVIAEPGSGIVIKEFQIHNFEQILRNKELQPSVRPDCIIRSGDQPYSKSVLDALSDWDEIPVIQFIARNSWQDHTMSVKKKIIIGPDTVADLKRIVPNKSNKWLSSWKEHDLQAESKLTRLITSSGTLTDGHIFHHFSPQIAEGWNVMISNSFTVRDMALFGKSPARTHVNRGAAGIDGIISTAIGISHSSDKPTCCFVGDIAFLHDSNALLSLRSLKNPFVIIVVNNGGGTIFRMLPVHGHKNYYSDYFETPQQAKLEQLAKSHSISYRKIDSIKKLKKTDINRFQNGVVIIEVQTDATASMLLRKKLWEP